MALAVRLLPQPDSPTRQTVSPSCRQRFTLRTAGSGPSAVAKVTERFSSCSRGLEAWVEGLFMGRAYQKVLTKKSLVGWGAEAEGERQKCRKSRKAGKKAKAGEMFYGGVGEPVRLIYANPTFTP